MKTLGQAIKGAVLLLIILGLVLLGRKYLGVFPEWTTFECVVLISLGVLLGLAHEKE